METTARHGAVRRDHSRVRPGLAGMGVFLLVAGLLLRFYAAPRLVVAPVSIGQTETLVARDASYFDQGTLTSRHGATLTLTATVRGDPGASTSKIAVWDSFQVLADRAHNATVTSTYERIAFNRHTGQLINCCGASLNDDTQIHQSGIGLEWPIGLRRVTYQVFDANTGRAWPAAYTGQRRVQGVLTYRFVQHIPSTVVQQMPGVPSSLLGLRGATRNVVASRSYQADNTFLVDPRTGVVLEQTVRALSVLRGPGGQGRLVAADFDLKSSPSSSRQLAALANKDAASIALVQVNGPLGGGVLGLLLILAGTVPFRRRKPGVSPDAADDPDA
jgi:hypothetical protein